MTGRIYYEQKEKNNKEDWKKNYRKDVEGRAYWKGNKWPSWINFVWGVDNTDGNKKMQRDDLT